MKTLKLKLTMLLFLLGLPFTLMASQLPGHYPSEFSYVGTIQSINLGTGAIIVRDKTLQLSASVRVNNAATRYANSGSLNQGMNIGYSLGEEAGQQTISEIWILPANYFDD